MIEQNISMFIIILSPERPHAGELVMPWVSNQTAHNIVVSITKNTGGTVVIPIARLNQPSTTGQMVQPWKIRGKITGRGQALRPETLRVVIGEKEITFEVQKDDHVNIYTNTYEVFTAKFSWFWYGTYLWQLSVRSLCSHSAGIHAIQNPDYILSKFSRSDSDA